MGLLCFAPTKYLRATVPGSVRRTQVQALMVFSVFSSLQRRKSLNLYPFKRKRQQRWFIKSRELRCSLLRVTLWLRSTSTSCYLCVAPSNASLSLKKCWNHYFWFLWCNFRGSFLHQGNDTHKYTTHKAQLRGLIPLMCLLVKCRRVIMYNVTTHSCPAASCSRW